MSSRQQLKSINIVNDSLKLEKVKLHQRQDDLVSLIQTLIRRQRQLTNLQQKLMEQQETVMEQTKIESVRKQLKCLQLYDSIDSIRKQIPQIDTRISYLSEQYEHCIGDYEDVISQVFHLIESKKSLVMEVSQQRNKSSTSQAVIFDYERLQRVLLQEKKYFKSLTDQQDKSHIERINQLKAIKHQLISEQNKSIQNHHNLHYQLAIIKLSKLFTKKIKNHQRTFLNGFQRFHKLTHLGITTFKNCLQIATLKEQNSIRKAFFIWNSTVFSKTQHQDLLTKSLQLNLNSKNKINSLNTIVEKLNSNSLSLLNLYERSKIVVLTASTLQKKSIYLAFIRWRTNTNSLKKTQHQLKKLNSVLTTLLMRNSFHHLKSQLQHFNRFQVGLHLLSKHENINQIAWAMRKWRLNVTEFQVQAMKKFNQRKEKNILVSKRVKYEKRRTKALTNLQLLVSKIQLRNYFNRYYQKTKKSSLYLNQSHVEVYRLRCGEVRKYNKSTLTKLQQKHTKLSFDTFSKLIHQIILKNVFSKIKSRYEIQSLRKQALLLVLMKKSLNTKYLAFNQFRKNVQLYQKKQMHQILTDLNNKMQRINEKSSKFRESLKKTIEELGVQSSKKINQISLIATNSQQKQFFNKYLRSSIQKDFRYLLARRTVQILSRYSKNIAFKTIESYWKSETSEGILAQREKRFLKKKQFSLCFRVFNSLLALLNSRKKAFSRLIHFQNVIYFYHLQSSFLKIKSISHQKLSNIDSILTDQTQKLLTNQSSKLQALQNNQTLLQQKLKTLFNKFLGFESISQRNKFNILQQSYKKKYFDLFRQNVKKIKFSHKSLERFFKLLQLKTYKTFWKSFVAYSYEIEQSGLKDELLKINKKKRMFEEKIQKTKSDTQKNLSQKCAWHEGKQGEANFYLKKYDTNLVFSKNKYQKFQNEKYIGQVFNVWKRETLGTKNIFRALLKIMTRKQLIQPCESLSSYFKSFEQKNKGHFIYLSLLQKKKKHQIKDAFNLWRYNMKHFYCNLLKYKVDHIDDHHDQIQHDALIQRQQYANQVIRNKNNKLKSSIFMGFKNHWIQSKQNNKKIIPFLIKNSLKLKADALRCWKWLIYYKHTKRSFLSYKKLEFEKKLKSDVFQSLKIHRQQIYNLAKLSQGLLKNLGLNLKRQSLNKIINFASYQKNTLIYNRKKILHSIVVKKMISEMNIKRTIMWKWQSQLIPRKHYLCNVLKNIELRILKSAFSRINDIKYWNQFYIKDTAEKVTNDGYSEVNSVTNTLMKQGFDPDELKLYLQKKNEKDKKVINQVIRHIKALPYKVLMVRGFHSWKEYVRVRKNIKRSLLKVLNFSTGLGRYFDRWRKKDPIFNEIIQRQSRQNMLERYYDLNRLMKQYRRDINNSLQNCQELLQINNQYSKSTKTTVNIAFSNLASSVSKGMKQGFQIWRSKTKQHKIIEANAKYDQIADGIQLLEVQKVNITKKIKLILNENNQLKQRCKYGQDCGDLLKKLILQKDGLSIDLAEKQHNMKILLEDNLRLKQKIKIAQSSALNLISKIKVGERS